VVHRDLKPANILVSAEGDPSSTPMSTTRTQAASMTIRVASPQVRGGPVTSRSVMYSLRSNY